MESLNGTEETIEKGQVGLVVLLVMVVLLTIGLSVISRSISDVKLSRQEEEASRVFDAAEAGIEQGLYDIAAGTFGPGSLTGVGDINVNYTTEEVAGRLEISIKEGHAAQVDVSNVAGGEQVAINWSKETNCDEQTPASVIVTVYNYNGASYSVRREAFEGCNHSDNFVTSGVTDGDGDYFKKVTISLSAGDKFVRVTPVYSDADIRAEGVGGYSLPVQYYTVRSVAENQLQEGTAETKAVEVSRTKPALPAVFDYILFSGTGLAK